MILKREMPKVALLVDMCCGCGACAAKCPKGCIEMEPDDYGFLHPVINADMCIGCGGCDGTCPVLNKKLDDKTEEVLWAKSKDNAERMNSSSGGVFALLARNVLLSGGMVCGAAWDEDCKRVCHMLVNSSEELDSIMRSKYVQSSISSEVYTGMREALSDGKNVLFAGTACQVAGMRAYLGKLADSDGFLTVDVICHGVPSPLLWEKWAAHREKCKGAALRAVNMRSKTTSWVSFSSLYSYREEKDTDALTEESVFSNDWYMKAFLSNVSLRPSCYQCPSKRSCGSDITLGDFWGIQSAHPEVDYEGGVSAVLCNTPKGVAAIHSIKGSLEWGRSSFEKVLPGNPSLVRSVAPFKNRREFMNDLKSGLSIEKLMNKYDFEPTFGKRLHGKLAGIKSKVGKLIRH